MLSFFTCFLICLFRRLSIAKIDDEFLCGITGRDSYRKLSNLYSDANWWNTSATIIFGC